MKRVITYGSYDLLHYGHIRLLERAKALGDYLIVGVTADDFDKSRGKINIQQSLMERIENVRATGLADEIIVEEYEGQKIDDIRRYGVDIFTVGSDWKGKFDYLEKYCQVVYLERTPGVSSTDIREQKRKIRLGIVGESVGLDKFCAESKYVNGVSVEAICTKYKDNLPNSLKSLPIVTDSYEDLLAHVDAVYLFSKPEYHYVQAKKALMNGKHVLCESPLTLRVDECTELFQLAEKRGLIIEEANKTAYSTAYSRLVLLASTGTIGKVVSVDATCTQLTDAFYIRSDSYEDRWNSICSWGPKGLLPIFQVLGCEYISKQIVTRLVDGQSMFDSFTKISFLYHNAVASVKVGKGVKSEGELIISGTKGYIYVPAPWWKTDYFEIRYENAADNRRFFYQLDGEGIRYEIVAFIKAIESGNSNLNIDRDISKSIVQIMEDFMNKTNVVTIGDD